MKVAKARWFLSSVIWLFLLASAGFLCGYMNVMPAAAGPAGGMAINHTCADILVIPQSAITQAKANLHIAYGHTSHGSQLTTGMSGLVSFMNGLGYPNNLYAWNNGGTGGALDLRDCPFSGASDLGNPNRTAWEQSTRNYLGTPNAQGRGSLRPEINVIMWSWCGQVDGSEADINTYLGLMNGLETDYPDVNFVYMTGHLNGTGATGNVNLRNQQIRNYCIANNKVLYDFADIESYDPDGLVHYMPLSANDNCDYDSDGNGSRDRNWAIDWQNAHTLNVDWYNCSAAHSQPLNGNLKAYAAWWLFARLAGWNPSPPATYTVTACVSGGHGTVSPASQTVNQGGAATINISPDAGYHAASITDNGNAVAVANPYRIANVQGNHSVVVTFEEDGGDEPPQPPGEIKALYLAEGCTGTGFAEYICLGNPGQEDAPATITYLFPDGGSQRQDVTVPASSRFTAYVNGVVGPDKEVSAKIESRQPILAERPMYFNYRGTWSGGHDAVATSAISHTWYFAEGYTGAGFDEYICVLNPGEEQAHLSFSFQTQEAGEQRREGYTVPGHSRKTFMVNEILGSGYQASLQLSSDQAVVAERSMYFLYRGKWSGGHCVMGARSLSSSYYFAEGTTRSGFEEWLTLQNPDPENPIKVHACYQFGPGQGPSMEKDYTVKAGERATLYIPREAGEGKDVSVKLTSEARFLAERPIYFRYAHRGVSWSGGHCVIGAPSPSMEWFFAEGYTGDNFHTWICLQNPGDAEARVQVSYYTPEGALDGKEVRIPAYSRVTLMANEHAGPDLELSCRLEVTSGPSVVAERPMYFSYQGWDGGHDVVGYAP